jgi:hypothetical protein
MPWVEFEPTVPASERAKTVYVLDRSATVTGQVNSLPDTIDKEYRPTPKYDSAITSNPKANSEKVLKENFRGLDLPTNKFLISVIIKLMGS